MFKIVGMEDFCMPAKVYFIGAIIINIIVFVTGKAQNPFFKSLASKKIKLTRGNSIFTILTIAILTLIIISLITIFFNYFCSLGYITGVGIVVTILLLLGISNLLSNFMWKNGSKSN